MPEVLLDGWFFLGTQMLGYIAWWGNSNYLEAFVHTADPFGSPLQKVYFPHRRCGIAIETKNRGRGEKGI